jgi:hypothetical protein
MPKTLYLPLVFVAACSFDTSYHLIAPHDPIRTAVDAQPETWPVRGFDDRAWPLQDGPMLASAITATPPRALARARFDLGSRYPAYRRFALALDLVGRWTARVNGTPVLEQSGGGTWPLDVPAGLLHAAGNVLAIEYSPSGQESFAIMPQLDGEPDPSFAGPMITRGPYLLAPSEDAVTIAWETNIDVPSRVVVDGTPWDGGAGRVHRVRVAGLLPSHSYRYRVEASEAVTEDLELGTAAPPGERLRFAVYGDTRTGGDTHRRMVQELLVQAPDFLLNTGDMVGSSTDSEWDKFFAIAYPLLARTPLYPTIGNHESDYGDGGRFTQLFPLGSDRFGGRVYSADYGAVHVAALDSNGDLGEQAAWLDEDLTAAEQRGARHLFVMMHWGPWSSGRSMNHGNNGEAIEHIVPVARAHHVSAMFGGHDHFYERGSASGLTYFVTGGGGAPLGGPHATAEARAYRAVNHYLLVDVVADRARVSAYDLSGTLFDEVELSARPR